MRRAVGGAAAVIMAAAIGACGGSTAAVSPTTLLQQADATINATSALHFELTSQHASTSGTTILGGSGDAVRPDELQGSFTVSVSNLPVTVKVVGVGGKFYAELPFTTSYTLTDPTTYGIGDPAQLIDPNDGLSSILPALTSVRSVGQTRIGSEVADELQGSLPGAKLPVLPDDDRSQAIAVTVDVIPSSHQVREIVLTGPFTSSTASTYTVMLTDYGEHIQIVAPPT